MATDYSSKVSQYVTGLVCEEVNSDPTYFKSLYHEIIPQSKINFMFRTSDGVIISGSYNMIGNIITYQVNNGIQQTIYSFSPDCNNVPRFHDIPRFSTVPPPTSLCKIFNEINKPTNGIYQVNLINNDKSHYVYINIEGSNSILRITYNPENKEINYSNPFPQVPISCTNSGNSPYCPLLTYLGNLKNIPQLYYQNINNQIINFNGVINGISFRSNNGTIEYESDGTWESLSCP